jgi:hypothetical protein
MKIKGVSLANQYEPPEEQEEPRAEPKQNGAQIFLEEISKTPEKRSRSWWTQVAFIPLLAVFTGLVIGGFFIIFTTPAVYDAFEVSFGQGISVAWRTISVAYTALFNGSLGNPAQIIQALQSG